jgi:hypothetical protein
VWFAEIKLIQARIMRKTLSISSLFTLVLAVTTASTAERAPITLTIKNFNTLTNAVATLAEAGSPGSAGEALAELQGMLGQEALQAMDANRPWQVGVWVEALGGRPATSVWVPTKDFAALESALAGGPLLQSVEGEATVTANADYAAVYLPGAVPSDTARAGHAAWAPSQIGTPNTALSLDIQPTDSLRQQLVQGLAMIRMMVGGAVGAQSQDALPGMDPMAMAQLLGVYFEVIEVGLKGWENVSIGLDVEDDSLRIRKRVTALAGSELATWLKGTEGSLTPVLAYADDTSPATFAFRWSEAPAYMPTLKKFLRLSMQMQGVPADSEAVTETERLLDLMAPMQLAGSVDFEEGMAFSGVYQFPGRDVKEIYGLMRTYLETSMQGQVGEGKPYSEATFKENQREVSGQQVDRMTMAFNLDAPLYQMPGQKEMIEGLFPGGKMEFDYVLKGDSLIIASPAHLEQLLQVDAASPIARLGTLRPTTVLAGRLNLLQLIPQFMKANPMLPEEAKQRFEGMDPRGTDIEFTVDLDGGLSSEAVVPLQLVRSAANTL